MESSFLEEAYCPIHVVCVFPVGCRHPKLGHWKCFLVWILGLVFAVWVLESLFAVISTCQIIDHGVWGSSSIVDVQKGCLG